MCCSGTSAHAVFFLELYCRAPRLRPASTSSREPLLTLALPPRHGRAPPSTDCGRRWHQSPPLLPSDSVSPSPRRPVATSRRSSASIVAKGSVSGCEANNRAPARVKVGPSPARFVFSQIPSGGAIGPGREFWEEPRPSPPLPSSFPFPACHPPVAVLLRPSPPYNIASNIQ